MRFAAGLVALIAGSDLAAAGDNDLALNRLAVIVDDGSTPAFAVGQNRDLRALVSELGVALAPRLLTPSDTLGFSGFQLSADLAETSITPDGPWWRARLGSPSPDATATTSHGSSTLSTVGGFVRKGLWLPAPSMELGVGAVHLLDSSLWTAQTYVKVALVEGLHDHPLPSVAVRGAIARLMGQKELDLTILSFDASVSKHVGVAGTWSIDPFAGWNLLVMVPRSEVIDPTPEIDPLDPMHTDDRSLNFVFKDQANITRHRFFVGAKVQYHVLELTVEGDLALAGGSVDDRGGASECLEISETSNCDSTDRAGSQRTLTISAGVDF